MVGMKLLLIRVSSTHNTKSLRGPDEQELIPTGQPAASPSAAAPRLSRLHRGDCHHRSVTTFHLSLFTFHHSMSAEHNLDRSLNGCGLGLYPGAELIFRGCFKGDRVGTMIEGEISGFGHHRELFVPDTTLD